MSETATAPPPAPAAPAAPAAAPVASTPAPAPSVLSTGAAPAAAPPATGVVAAATPAAAPPADPNAWLPEKHRVMAADGKLDLEASARKVAEAYGHAERRIGGGDAAPTTLEGYKVNVPSELGVNADELAKAPDFQQFLGKMHGLGLSQKQLDGVTATLVERGIKMREANAVMDATEAQAALRGTDGWKTDGEYQAKVSAAFKAGKTYGGADWDGITKDYGNDPRIIRLLANVGAELAEDHQPSPEAQQQLQENLDTLMASKAYLNNRDPNHAATFAKVSALQAKMAGNAPVAQGRSMSFKTG